MSETRKTKWVAQYVPGGKGRIRVRHRDSDKYDKVVFSQAEARDYITSTDKTLKYDYNNNLIIPSKVRMLDPNTGNESVYSSKVAADAGFEIKAAKAKANQKVQVQNPYTGEVKSFPDSSTAQNYLGIQDSLQNIKEGQKLDKNLTDLNKIQNLIGDLETTRTLNDGLNPQQEMQMKILQNREKQLYFDSGIDTSGVGDFNIPQDTGFNLGDYIPSFLKPSEEGRWKTTRRNELFQEIQKEDVPKGMSKSRYIRQLADEEWEQRRNPADLSNQELINRAGK